MRICGCCVGLDMVPPAPAPKDFTPATGIHRVGQERLGHDGRCIGLCQCCMRLPFALKPRERGARLSGLQIPRIQLAELASRALVSSSAAPWRGKSRGKKMWYNPLKLELINVRF